MTRLQLNFLTSGSTVELVSTTFEHPLIQQTIHAFRGKSAGALSGSGTFQWTPAVRALSILIIKTKCAAIVSNCEHRPVLQAMDRGAVSALDYAISRRASWISDMFGTDSKGNLIARRIFKRSNSERKRPGPVCVALNSKFLTAQSIDVFLDGKLLSEPDELETLAVMLLSSGDQTSPITIRSGEPRQIDLADSPSLRGFRASFLQELHSMLCATDIFTPRRLRTSLSELGAIPELHGVHKDICSELESVDLKLIGSERLGLSLTTANLETLFPGGKPLRFGVTPSQIGTIALLRFLRDVRKLPVEIDYSFAHTKDLADGVESGGKGFPDCCVMTTASYALMKPGARREYRPIMVMPAATHSIMGRENSVGNPLREAAEYHLLSEFPTTPSFWFSALSKSGVLNPKNSKLIHSDPDQSLEALNLSDGSIRTILWFPYNIIAAALTRATPLLQSPALGSGLSYIQNMLFVHQSIAHDQAQKRLLDILIRDAWLNLLESSQTRAEMITKQLDEEEYRSKLWRYSGLYKFSAQFAA